MGEAEEFDVAFQLVQATDTEIIVWHTELGHVFGFSVDSPARTVVARFTRDIPEAEAPAASVQDEAHSFAVGEAKVRRLIL